MNRRNEPDFGVVLKGHTDLEPVLRFEGGDLHPRLAQTLYQIFQVEIPTPIQKFSIPAVAKGLDVIGLSQTGSGKTAAFLIPILDQLMKKVIPANSPDGIIKPTFLILTPTRELALQICEDAKAMARGTYIICRSVYGGIRKQAQLAAFQNGVHILTASPGRLEDHLREPRPEFVIDLSRVSTVVIDEADHMLECDFKIMEEIFQHPTFPPLNTNKIQMLFFSATTSKFLENSAMGLMKKERKVIIECGEIGRASSYIDQVFLKDLNKKEEIIKLLNELPMKTLIFVNSIEMSLKVALFLQQSSLEPNLDREAVEAHIARLKERKAANMHLLNQRAVTEIDEAISMFEKKLITCKVLSSDMNQIKRERILRHFKNDNIKCLVATDVACRGLHIPGPLHVINYDMPRTGALGDRVRAYVHRIGRTGRMGENGRATSFFNPQLDGLMGPDMYWQLIDRQQIVPEIIKEYEMEALSRGPPKVPKGSKKSCRRTRRQVNVAQDDVNDLAANFANARL